MDRIEKIAGLAGYVLTVLYVAAIAPFVALPIWAALNIVWAVVTAQPVPGTPWGL